MFPTPHSLSITGEENAPSIVCPYDADELCRSCLIYTPCGCRVSGDFETTRAHDGEACPVRRGQHVVLRPDAVPVAPGCPARSGELGVLYVPRYGRCALRDTELPLALYTLDGRSLDGPLAPGHHRIERWREAGDYLLLAIARPPLVEQVAQDYPALSLAPVLS